MKLNDPILKKFSLVQEMFETVDVIRNFDSSSVDPIVENMSGIKNIFLTGEGSSRIFPAKRLIDYVLKNNLDLKIHTEGALQSLDYDLSSYSVIVASNSGKTSEAVRLLNLLKENGHKKIFSVVANAETPLQELANESVVLSCGSEKAVAASKSVMEQTLVYDIIIRKIAGLDLPDFNELADKINEALEIEISEDMVEKIASSDTVFFAGKNNGVSEELALKTIEITRKKSSFLEGTYALHGIEEVLTNGDCMIVVDPFSEEEDKFKSCLMDRIGMPIFVTSHKNSIFKTVKLPFMDDFNEYIQLAAGWNLLLNVGLALGIDVDKPLRARKIGNEYIK